MKKIVIFGSGSQAKVVIDIVEKSMEYQIYGIIDRFLPVHSTVCGYEVLGDESSLLKIKSVIDGGIIAIGDNWTRKQYVEKIKAFDSSFNYVSVFHPSAVISDRVKIGDGTVVTAGVVINGDTFIGKHCLINTHSSIDHDCTLGNYVSIAPGSTLGGNVKVGENSAISLGAKVIHSVTIGEHTVIGAGSTVVRDVDPYVIAYGSPAKKIRRRTIGEKYL